ncbi:MAG: alpha-amylase, partial [Gammaproteobacteria bacterium]|nr:alpha-amylase [Gammaproteobacteria bacterium]
GHETQIPSFSDDIYEVEPEAFSADLDWMPHLVLIAKSTYVWLDQLSKQYKRPITRLDQIPDEELNRLANYGFTGLWFIGLWERSVASQKIKQINGNPEAVASAYSLKNYDIAEDIGGLPAYLNLKERAWKRGIRLASDMVPNHMAIDSDWVKNHPHWFLQTDQPPFPNHTFNGAELANDDSMAIYIEDG